MISRAKERKTAADGVERLRVKTPSYETKAANLSGGNQQKVVLAKWLAPSQVLVSTSRRVGSTWAPRRRSTA